MISEELSDGKLLREELINFKLKQNPETGHVSYEYAREGDHDDLVLALCLSLWAAEKPMFAPVVIPNFIK